MDWDEYAKRVTNRLASNPTSADLDYLVEAFTTVGYLSSGAAGDADMAEAKRKHEEAQAYVEVKREARESGEKMTEAEATALVTVKVWPYKQAEVQAFGRARKLQALRDSIEQAINAVKFLHRNDQPTMTLPGSK